MKIKLVLLVAVVLLFGFVYKAKGYGDQSVVVIRLNSVIGTPSRIPDGKILGFSCATEKGNVIEHIQTTCFVLMESGQ